ncbi:F-box protein [Pyrus ussuriensis x Pyrus communis]|uniref:F-box protein n=1 Tax=Pyrus ussuriensis x Pyrus communis TaxID=2448454 RepID=A0A5N5FKB5_9ROSA|nr:F-box protein [Pyrus ussuriensis x Pyrus communis]
MPSLPLGSSIRKNRISLNFFKTWVDEWWVMPVWSRLLLSAAKESGSSTNEALTEKALMSPILLKMRRRKESGRRSKWLSSMEE